MKYFYENKDGVHLVSALNGEYSLCGDAYDIGSDEGESCEDLVDTDKKTVTCKKCIIEIQNCRAVKTKSAT